MSEMVDRLGIAYEFERRRWRQAFTTHDANVMVACQRIDEAGEIVVMIPAMSLEIFERTGWFEYEYMRSEASSRAGIAVMRQPTTKMSSAGTFTDLSDLAEATWKRMIDEALK